MRLSDFNDLVKRERKMRRRAGVVVAFFVTLIFSVITLSESVQAIPAFARKYEVKCTRCHTQFPQLNEEGIAFKQRGYRELGEVGDFVWEQDVWPIGALMKLRHNYKDVTDKVIENFFDGHELEFFGAGTMAPKVSYFFDFEAHGFTSSAGDPGGRPVFEAKRFFVILDDLVPESKVNVKAGIFINEFHHFTDHNKLTWEGHMGTVSRDQAGVEVNGLLPAGRGGLNYALAIVNDERTLGSVNNNLDAFYGWTSYTYAKQIVGVRFYSAPTAKENHTQWDFNVRLNRGPVYLLTGAFFEDNVGGVRDKRRNSFNIDLTYFSGKKGVLLVQYDLQDDPDVKDKNDRILFGAQYHIWPNVKLLAEWYHKVTREAKTKFVEEDRVRVGFIVAF